MSAVLNNVVWSFVAVAVYLVGGQAHGAPPSSTKKGAGTWSFPGEQKALKDVNASWFYNWSPSPPTVTAPADLQFVPMIWSKKDVTPEKLASVKHAPVLLGFNEPDHEDQSNLSVKQALALWPQVAATGALRLGSPATASDPRTTHSWLESFMAGVNARGLRVDFICVHWYLDSFDPPTATAALKTFLQGVYKKYKLPIWVTEYAMVRWSTPPAYATREQQAAFARSSAAMMDALPFVERYAWFALPPSAQAPGLTSIETVSLYDVNGTATVTGVGYREAGNP